MNGTLRMFQERNDQILYSNSRDVDPEIDCMCTPCMQSREREFDGYDPDPFDNGLCAA
jgi:hypothetical protein